MTAQTDGRAITDPENAQNFSHAEIKQAADQMNPDGLDGAFDAWSAIAAAVTKAGQQFETAITQAVEQHWEGAAADQAVRGIQDYATRVGELGESLDQQSTPLSSAASAATRFKVAVPPVAETSGNPRGPELRNTQEEQARDDMSTLYIQPYGITAPAIPTLPPPVDPISVPGVSPGVVPGTSATDTGSGQPGKASESSQMEDPSKTADAGKAGDPSKSADQGKTTDAGGTDAPGKTEAVAPQSVSPTPSSSTSTVPTSATHTSTTSTVPSTSGVLPTAPTTVTSAGITPGTSSPSRTATAPSPGGTPDSTPSPGKSVPGTTTPGAAAAQPSTGTPSRVGTAGAAGYSGMLPPGARGRRGEDGEHKAAAYLRTEEHGEELIGEVDKTVPPVLGAQ
jgi:hypothetical protein